MKTKFPKAIDWQKDHLLLLDQRKIPKSIDFIRCNTLESVIDAIKLMIVRGAPAIALSGMYGLVLYFQSLKQKESYSDFLKRLQNLLESRPTAVNLRLAMQEFQNTITENIYEKENLKELIQIAETFANRLFSEDLETNRKIAENGANIFGSPRRIQILTHCNTGAIATAGIGTALGVIRVLHQRGFEVTVFADETRPYHQGSRLTAWEMEQEGIECFIISDSMSGWLMNEKKIDAVLVGADRIASNGDTANKIGTYNLGIVAKEHGVPFYVACSETSFDFQIESGKEIHIEMRSEDELTQNSFLKDINGKPIYEKGILAPIHARALNPSFDVTPAKYITGIIMEKGVITPVSKDAINDLLNPK